MAKTKWRQRPAALITIDKSNVRKAVLLTNHKKGELDSKCKEKKQARVIGAILSRLFIEICLDVFILYVC